MKKNINKLLKQCMKEIAEVLNKKLAVIIIQHWSNLQILQAACYKNAPDFAEMRNRGHAAEAAFPFFYF